jgi:hypothetical protein
MTQKTSQYPAKAIICPTTTSHTGTGPSRSRDQSQRKSSPAVKVHGGANSCSTNEKEQLKSSGRRLRIQYLNRGNVYLCEQVGDWITISSAWTDCERRL